MGASANVWNNLYAANINNMSGSNADPTHHKVINGDTRHAGTFYPEIASAGTAPENAIYDLGNATHYWNRLYIRQIISPNNALGMNCNDIINSGNILPCTNKELGSGTAAWKTTYTGDLKVDRITGPVTPGSYMIDFTGNGINNSGTIIPNQNQTLGNAANHWSGIYTDGLRTTSGTVYGNWTLAAGATWQATYADLAERYEADENIVAGSVVILGGEKEVSASSEDASIDVFGVVATNPAYLLNACAGVSETHPPIAKVGRIPCRVIGTVKKVIDYAQVILKV